MIAIGRNHGRLIACVVLCAVGGCRTGHKQFKSDCDDGNHYKNYATDIEYPAVDACIRVNSPDVLKPRDLESAPPQNFKDLKLEEAISIALRNSKVLKDVGGRVLTAPDISPTVYDPAIRESDPNFGPEGALSAFDAQLTSNALWRKNDQVFNNPISGGAIGGQHEFQQDLFTNDIGIRKRTATGAEFSFSNVLNFDRNNANPTNKLFAESWDSQLNFTARQPLLQGAGTVFNRIAGPVTQPGLNSTTGILLARINTDISLADFDSAVIDFSAEVERAYWELYFAYRDLDAAVLARDEALSTWRTVKGKYESNLKGGEAYQEARSRAQYYLFQDQVQDALNGVSTVNSGTLARSVGVYAGERRLRWLLGLPATGCEVLRPIDEPSTAKITLDWTSCVQEALVERVELRRQRWQVKRGELQLLASRNFLLPRLDTLATYRVRGFGNHLVNDQPIPGGTPEQNRFNSSFGDLGTFDHQEWETGLQLAIPLGFRQAWSGVRQAELQLTRQKAILCEQESLVALELSNAVGESTRAYAAVCANFERLTAAQQDRLATRTAYEADQLPVDLLLDSQQRLAEAQRQYFRSLTNYSMSLMELQVRKGTLLAYDGIYLSEGSWPRKAYRDAAENDRRWKPKRFSTAKILPGVVSEGHFESEFLPEGETAQPVPIQPQKIENELPQPLKEQPQVPTQAPPTTSQIKTAKPLLY